MPIKVLLDTDIGSDIDDAICLAYLLANPECKLLGITTVTAEADARASMASAMCKVAGKPIPPLPFRPSVKVPAVPHRGIKGAGGVSLAPTSS
jgi:inosine-uridine nucleoside N-ribohydrolase